MLPGARRAAGAVVGHVDLVHAVELAGGVAGQHARQAGLEAGAHGHHHTSLAGLGVQVEQVLDRADAVGHRHDVPAGGHGPLGHREVAGGGDASTTTSAAEGSGSSTASALSPSELATGPARRRRSGSSTRTAVVSAPATRCRAARRRRPRHTRGSAR